MIMPAFDFPPLRITPVTCDLIADRLSDAVDKLRAWEYRVQESSRLPAAIRVLRRIASQGTFSSDSTERVRIGNALRIGLDYPRLCEALGNGDSRSVRESVKRSLGGTLDDVGATQALQAQAELRIVSVIAASGRNALIPLPTGRKSPDLVVVIDALPIAIEVKCPGSETAMVASVEEAVRQLATFGQSCSAVCIDLTDCIRTGEPGSSVPRDEFQRLDALANAYLVQQASSPGYDRIALAITVATLILWELHTDISVHPMLWAAFTPYSQACSGLVVEQTKGLMRTLESGYHSLGALLPATAQGSVPGAG
jgi:hypothetical protein